MPGMLLRLQNGLEWALAGAYLCLMKVEAFIPPCWTLAERNARPFFIRAPKNAIGPVNKRIVSIDKIKPFRFWLSDHSASSTSDRDESHLVEKFGKLTYDTAPCHLH
ncbi:hypothetical protein [Pontibaca salina]|uniref:Uncharacterized protein n=1 Tax=Pontibaca salina TaxID=2795731 RepID=A0A934M091_9RHOB|nr:hypothetical protein [Pontibaca salina]MBI6628421.1 hypothetical protein [Pontibaca salina]